MKLVANIDKILQPGIHKIGTVIDGEIAPGADLPTPDRVVIELENPEEPCMMFRYSKEGFFCGDTWHENLEQAFSQANFEYGLSRTDFVRVVENGNNDA